MTGRHSGLSDNHTGWAVGIKQLNNCNCLMSKPSWALEILSSIEKPSAHIALIQKYTSLTFRCTLLLQESHYHSWIMLPSTSYWMSVQCFLILSCDSCVICVRPAGQFKPDTKLLNYMHTFGFIFPAFVILLPVSDTKSEWNVACAVCSTSF